MTKATIPAAGHRFKTALPSKARPTHRRKRRLLLESLEDRTLLNASIDIDAAGLLTYQQMDTMAAETLRVSVSGDVYEFDSDLIVDVVSNVPGLVVTGDGTSTVTVQGISALVMTEYGHDSVLKIASSNVPTTVNVNASFTDLTFGSPDNPLGLAALTAPIRVTGTVDFGPLLDDTGSTRGTYYSIRSTAVSTDSGFGGLTYPSDASLQIRGSAAAAASFNTYTITSTSSNSTVIDSSKAQGESRFYIYGTADSQRSDQLLSMRGGVGLNTYFVAETKSLVAIDGAGGPSALYLTNGVTTKINGIVAVRNTDDHPIDIHVDGVWNPQGQPWILAPSDYVGPQTAQLTGFSQGGKLYYDPRVVDRMYLRPGWDRNTALAIDLTSGNPLPAGSGPGFDDTALYYDGGFFGSRDVKTELILFSVDSYKQFAQEVHNATAPGAGDISLVDAATGLTSKIVYSNLSERSIYDTVLTADYTFNYAGDPNVPIAIGAGEASPASAGFQTLSIIARGTAPAVVDTYVANKRNVTVRADATSDARAITLDYGATAPVAGLLTLTLSSGLGDDSAQLFNLPPDVTTFVQQGGGDDQAYIRLPGTADADGVSLDGGDGGDVLTLDADGQHLSPGDFSVDPLDSTFTAISGVPLVRSPIKYANYERAAFTNLASPPVVAVSTLHGLKLRPLVDAVVGTFTSAAPGAKAGDFTATIDWGDESLSAGTIVQDASNPSTFYVMGTHTYGQGSPAYTTHLIVASAGSLLATTINGVPVTFSTPASGPVTAAGAAVIADSALTPSATQPAIPDAREGIRFNDVVVGSFQDLNPNPNLAGYIVTIDWGDDSPASFGRVVQPGGPGTTLYVLGSHTFTDSAPPGTSVIRPAIFPPFPLTYTGTFPVLIHVQDSGGSAATLSNTITVQDRPLSVSGGLDPASDSGASSSDAITNVVQPTFRGRASEGGARISLYISGLVSTKSGDFPSFFSAAGAAAADATGEWRITLDSLLPDGVYSVRVQAFDADGPTTSPATTIVERMVVDTVGPRVSGLVFDNRRGQIVATLQDFGGAADAGVGLDFATVVDANNYRFAPALPASLGPRRAVRWIVGGIAVDPGTYDGAQAATITINGGRGFRDGRYLFTARSVAPSNLTGVQDLAGNALDGEFYSSFPSGNDHIGGDFVAGLDAVHRRVYAPKTMIGAASPVAPPRLRSAGRITLQPGLRTPRRHTRLSP